MINLPLRQVATFVCLAETQSFRRAAERLHLSQPAVSAHIRELERQVGVPLVHRTTRHVSLTAEGQAFAVRAKRALDELDMASQDLRELAAVQRGRVTVACIVPLMTTVVPNVVRRIKELHPGLEIEIRDILSAQIDQLIVRGEVDFAIGPRPTGGNLTFARLERDYFVAAVPLGHPLAGRGTINLRELLDYPIITTTRNTNARMVLERAVHQLHQTLQPRFELVHHFSVGRMVEAGLGVTVLPRTSVPSLASSRIVAVDIKSPRIFRDVGLITRREYQYSPAAQVFVTILKTFFTTPVEREDETPRPAKLARGRQLVGVSSS
jgi:LysR family transcriptional regulator, carnitine catabolism transcriptional activator